uniref:Uncharacterized protein n=1 Tax=Lactuca sativa TaxID=4236 RepID=A0A9R1UM80_LACSA|nr:hypothetical protein LSAT_V11C800390870 [Lactuca sativa]
MAKGENQKKKKNRKSAEKRTVAHFSGRSVLGFLFRSWNGDDENGATGWTHVYKYGWRGQSLNNLSVIEMNMKNFEKYDDATWINLYDTDDKEFQKLLHVRTFVEGLMFKLQFDINLVLFHLINYVLHVIFTISLAFVIGLTCAFTSIKVDDFFAPSMRMCNGSDNIACKVILEAAILTVMVVATKRGSNHNFLGSFLFGVIMVHPPPSFLSSIFFPSVKKEYELFGSILTS